MPRDKPTVQAAETASNNKSKNSLFGSKIRRVNSPKNMSIPVIETTAKALNEVTFDTEWLNTRSSSERRKNNHTQNDNNKSAHFNST